MMDWQAIFISAAPELFLAATGLIGILVGSALQTGFAKPSITAGALVLFIAAGLALVNIDGGVAFGGLWETDRFTNIAKAVAYLSAGIALLIAEGYLTREHLLRFEYAILVIFASLGMGIMLSANDLMPLYLGIEMLALSSYILAAFNRDSQRSSEAGLKYFVLGALASGLILYGASLVYGFSGGSTGYDAIALSTPNTGIMFGLVLIVTGMAFKVSAAPLHVWTPDVYEGAPTPVVAFFASAPKIAAMIVFATLLFEAFPQQFRDWQSVIVIISGASMLVGSIGALRQTNIKRLMGYSSIGNMGYALIAVAAGAEIGAASLLVYMIIYALTTLGVFAVVLCMRRRGGMVEDISELSGLSRTKPWLAICLTALLVSLGGIPPFGGFFGKWVVFGAGLEAGLLPLVLIGVVASVISLGYYLKIIMIMWGGDPAPAFESVSSRVGLTVTAASLLTLPVIPVFIGTLMLASGGAFGIL